MRNPFRTRKPTRPPPPEPAPTSVSHAVHLGEKVDLLVTATRHESGYPIFVIKVATSDDKFDVDLYVNDREQYEMLRDKMRLTETLHESYSGQPKVITYADRVRIGWADLASKMTKDDLWGPLNNRNESETA